MEYLVHLSGQVRLVAAYPLEIGLGQQHPLSALLEDLRPDFFGLTFEARDLVARLGAYELEELLLGRNDAAVHYARFGRYLGFAGEPVPRSTTLSLQRYERAHTGSQGSLTSSWLG